MRRGVSAEVRVVDDEDPLSHSAALARGSRADRLRKDFARQRRYRRGMPNILLTRRAFTFGTAGGALLAACAGDRLPPPAHDTPVTPVSPPARCTVHPELTEGPFYLDLDSLKRDITDGKPGVPLALTIRVLAARGCAPLSGVAVDIWHCDAGGLYSGYDDQVGGVDTRGQTFLRGTQVSDAAGRVTFATIYPGWYPGRTAHIHTKIHLAGNREAISQLFFPQDITEAVYATAPYRDPASDRRYTTNDEDGVLDHGDLTLLGVTAVPGGYAATVDMAVV